jgi:hypothetical protein
VQATNEWTIDGYVWSSNTLLDDLTILIDVNGPRLCGTLNEQRAGEWLVQRLRQCGLENVHKEPFEYTGWRDLETRLQVSISPQHPRPMMVASHVYSPPTPVTGLKADLVFVGAGRPRQFEMLEERTRGNFVLCETTPWPVFWKGCEDVGSPIERAIEAGAVGFILMGVAPGAGPRVGSCPRGELCPIPCVGIGKEDGEFLKRALNRGKAVTVTLYSLTETEIKTAFNVVGEIGGNEDAERTILLSAHYDGHRIGQGALDNASGVVAVLETAKILVTMRDQLKSRIRIIFFSAEELGMLGSKAYAAQHRHGLERVPFIMNVDIAWPPFGLAVQASPELTEAIRELNFRLGLGLHVHDTLSMGSDHSPFVKEGVPAIVYEGAVGPGGTSFCHTRADTFDKVDLEGVRRATSTICKVLFNLATREQIPCKRLSSQDLKTLLQADK